MNFLVDYLQNIFDPTPPAFSNYHFLFIALTVVFIVSGIGLKLYMKAHKEDKAFKRVFRNFPFRLIVTGILMGLYAFLRYSYVPFLSMRIFMIADLIAMIYIGYKVVIAYTKQYPELKKHAKDTEERNKYSVKKRKK